MNFLVVSFLLYFWHVIFHFVFHLIIRTIQFPSNLSKMDDISSYFKNSTKSYGKFSLEYSISIGKPYDIYINLYIWFMSMNFLCLLQRNTLGLWLLKILKHKGEQYMVLMEGDMDAPALYQPPNTFLPCRTPYQVLCVIWFI
jgi:hypothetical protein